MTDGQRHKRRRNLVLYALWRSGRPFSERFLADVLDLPRSRVSVVVQGLRREEEADTGMGLDDVTPEAFRAWVGRKVKETERPPGNLRRGRASGPPPRTAPGPKAPREPDHPDGPADPAP